MDEKLNKVVPPEEYKRIHAHFTAGILEAQQIVASAQNELVTSLFLAAKKRYLTESKSVSKKNTTFMAA